MSQPMSPSFRIPVAPATPPPAPRAKLSSKNLLIILLAGGVASTLLVAVGVWAFFAFVLGVGQSPSKSAVAFPADTVQWTELAIDPSNAQKAAVAGLVSRLDGVKTAIRDSQSEVNPDDLGSTDLRQAIWDYLTDDANVASAGGLDYERDIKPWIGSRLAIGVLPSVEGDTGPRVIVAIEASDLAKAKTAAEDFLSAQEGFDASTDTRDGYLIIATSNIDLSTAYNAGTLADTAIFKDASKDVGDWGLVSSWTNLGKVYATSVAENRPLALTTLDEWKAAITASPLSFVSAEEAFNETDGVYTLDEVPYPDAASYAAAYAAAHLDELATQQRDAFTPLAQAQANFTASVEKLSSFQVIRAADSTLEVTGRVSGVPTMEELVGGSSKMGDLPADTYAAVSLPNATGTLNALVNDANVGLVSSSIIGAMESLAYAGGTNFTTLSGQIPPVWTRSEVDNWLSQNLGINVESDLPVLLGDEATISGNGDLSELLGSTDATDTTAAKMAVTVTTKDPAATGDAWRDLIKTLPEGSSDTISVDEGSGKLVVSTGGVGDDILTPDKKLSAVNAWRKAVPDAGKSSAAAYINITGIIDALKATGAETDFSVLDGVSGAGLTVTIASPNDLAFRLRVTTD